MRKHIMALVYSLTTEEQTGFYQQ